MNYSKYANSLVWMHTLQRSFMEDMAESSMQRWSCMLPYLHSYWWWHSRMETEKTSVFRQWCPEILFILSRSLGFMNLDHGCSDTSAVFKTSPYKLQLSPEGSFAAKLRKTSSDLPAALGWVDNDWIFCWTYPLIGVLTAQVGNIYAPKLR